MEKFRLRPPEPKEADITREIRGYLRLRGIWHYKNWSGLGSMRGVADLIGIYRGKYLAIEVKGPKGRESPAQIEFLDRVNREGGLGFVARSVHDVMEALK